MLKSFKEFVEIPRTNNIIDDDGQRWTKTDRDDIESTYGDMSYMWEYKS